MIMLLIGHTIVKMRTLIHLQIISIGTSIKKIPNSKLMGQLITSSYMEEIMNSSKSVISRNLLTMPFKQQVQVEKLASNNLRLVDHN